MRINILILFFVFNYYTGSTQTSPSELTFKKTTAVEVIRLNNAKTYVGENIPKGSILIDISTNKLYLVKNGIANKETITTAIASLELINNTIIKTKIINDVTTGGALNALSAEQGKLLKGMIDVKINKTVGYDLSKNDFTDILKLKLDDLSNVKVLDNLSSAVKTYALSANQGRILKNIVDAKLDKTLKEGSILVGNGSNIGVEVSVSGDATLTKAGEVVIGKGKITVEKIAKGSPNQILVTNALGTAVEWKTNKSSITSLVTTTDNYITTVSDATVLVNPSQGLEKTISLLTTGTIMGKKYIVKKANTTSGVVKVKSETGTIEGLASVSTNVPYQGWIFQYDGINWHIVGHI